MKYNILSYSITENYYSPEGGGGFLKVGENRKEIQSELVSSTINTVFLEFWMLL